MTRGHLLPVDDGVSKAVAGILKKCIDNRIFDVVLVPMLLKGGYNYVMAENADLLDNAVIMPPVMSVHGGKAVMSMTRYGQSKKVAAVLRPCEIRAAVELAKLRQADLENIFFISMDCPGVAPLTDYIRDGNKKPANTEPEIRPLCSICDNFSLTGEDRIREVDLHIGSLGVPEGNVLLIPDSIHGEELLAQLGMEAGDDTTLWLNSAEALRKDRQTAREKALAELKEEISGLDGLMQAFSRCIECHNCRNVCPVCYCRLCFTDRNTMEDAAGSYIDRATSQGALRILPEPLLFQLGRMSHMSLSCVSCGMCEDVCPVDIPVGRIFSCVSIATRGLFGYAAGSSVEQELPFKKFELEELTDVEDR